jgi:hypothetical protein
MEEFKEFLFAWNEWVVLPILTLVGLVLHTRWRKSSTLVLCVGMLMLLGGGVLTKVYSQSPLHIGYIIGLIIGVVGLLASMVGAIWFYRKDYVTSSNQA